MKLVFDKALAFVLLLVVLTTVAIGLQSMRGGSAALATAGQRASQQELQKLRKELGEDKNFALQWLGKIKQIATFNFGKTVKGQPVFKLVWQAFKYTFILAALASLFALFYAIVLSTIGQMYDSVGRVLHNINYFLLANPVFIIALLLIWVFAIGLDMLPPGGTILSGWYILPALALGLKAAARLSIFIDEFMTAEKKKPYVLTLHAYGFSKQKIYGYYVFKNLALPILSFWLIDFASYLAGAAIIETIHSIPGIGSLLLKALFSYDLNLIVGILAFVSIFIFFIGIVQEVIDHHAKRYSTSNQA